MDEETKVEKKAVSPPSSHTVEEWTDGFRKRGIRRHTIVGAVTNKGWNRYTVVTEKEFSDAIEEYRNLSVGV